MVSPIRTAVAVLHILALLAGCALAISGIWIGSAQYLDPTNRLDPYGRPYNLWSILQVTMIGAAWLLTTLAFAFIFLKRGISLISPLAYAISCAVQGVVFAVVAIGIGKNGAPGPAWEPASLIDLRYVRAYGAEGLEAEPVFAILLTAACIALTCSRSSWIGISFLKIRSSGEELPA